MMGDGYFGVSSAAGIVLSVGNPTTVIKSPGSHQAGSSSCSPNDAETGLKHDTGLAVEWSPDEQSKVEEGLVRFSDEPSIMKYIKIAASLHDKSVRDVALRCRWMARKWLGKKANIRKNLRCHFSPPKKRTMALASSCLHNMALHQLQELAEPSYMITSALPSSMTTYSSVHNMDHSNVLRVEGTSSDVNIRNLLQHNNEALDRIRANLNLFKLQENVDLFFHAWNNITAILNNMRTMPGIMSQMPPLPVFINEDVANTMPPYATQTMVFGSDCGIPLRQERRF
ncbi:hypothetical protein SAY87_031164 [Trapa incisa]|uniref:Uncharacterized protein n=1 Tax=Trapa incisa TaxID=236973 RepID=A0AAN7KX13_9MYRT|nr:hypothetical protein SAY87_031164 [Trapa incisa]